LARSVGVDSSQLRAAARTLTGSLADRRASGIDPRGLGGSMARGAFDRFESYWSAGLTAVAQSFATLADVLETAASSYERRDAEDAAAVRNGQGQFFGF
jgi:hypothetical protein